MWVKEGRKGRRREGRKEVWKEGRKEGRRWKCGEGRIMLFS
jgi:hypothetical protein